MCMLPQVTQREVQETPRNFVGLTWWNNPEMPRETGRGPFLVNVVFVKTSETCRKLVGRTVTTCLLNFWDFLGRSGKDETISLCHTIMISRCETTYFTHFHAILPLITLEITTMWDHIWQMKAVLSDQAVGERLLWTVNSWDCILLGLFTVYQNLSVFQFWIQKAGL